MNKYAYLEELRKRIGRLSRYQVDNIVNDYSQAIGRMLDDYRDWEQIQREIGTPKEAAKRVMDGKPMYIRSDSMYVGRNRDRDDRYDGGNDRGRDDGFGQDGGVYDGRGDGGYDGRNDRVYDDGRGYNDKPQKKGMSAGWKAYLIMGLVTVPLTIAFFAVIFGLGTAAIALIVSGPAAIIYSAVVGIMAASPVLFFVYCAAGLLVLGIGLLMLWAIKQLLWPIKAVLFKKRG